MPLSRIRIGAYAARMRCVRFYCTGFRGKKQGRGETGADISKRTWPYMEKTWRGPPAAGGAGDAFQLGTARFYYKQAAKYAKLMNLRKAFFGIVRNEEKVPGRALVFAGFFGSKCRNSEKSRKKRSFWTFYLPNWGPAPDAVKERGLFHSCAKCACIFCRFQKKTVLFQSVSV